MRFKALWMVLGLALVAAPVFSQTEGGTPPKKEEAKADPEVQSWLDTLIGQLGKDNAKIRQSVEAAIVSIGKEALPKLEAISKTGDDKMKAVANRMIERINRPAAQPGRGEGPARGDANRGDGQGRGAGRTAPADQAKAIGTELNLSEENTKKLETTITAHQARMQDAMQKAREEGGDRESMRETMQTLRDELKKELGGYLTAEQVEKAMGKMTGGGMRRGGQGGQGGEGRRRPGGDGE